jgi:hypothetical protein
VSQEKDITQKSIGKAKFTSTEECTPGSLGAGGGGHAHQPGSLQGLSDAMLPLSCPWIGEVLGSKSMWLAN